MKIRRTGDGRYEIDGAPVASVEALPGAVKAIKKPIPITACRIEEPFTVDTTEGVMRGRPGDWLMQGVAGEVYVCPGEVFERSYDILPR